MFLGRMAWLGVLAVAGLCLLSASLWLSPLTVSAVADDVGQKQAVVTDADNWPLFRGDSRSSGVSHGSLPRQLELLWKQSFENEAFTSSPVIVDGTVFIGGLEGHLYALDLATGEEKWKFSTEAEFAAAPAVRDGAVFIGDLYGKFYCVDAASGELKWSFESDASIDGSANFYKDRVLFGSQDATLYCLGAADGQLVWKHQIDDQIRCCPTVVENLAFVAGCDGRLHMIDLDTGEDVKAVDIGGPTMCTPAVDGDLVFLGTESETFLGINWRKAEVVWTYRHPKRSFAFRSSAAAALDVVVVGGRDRMVHGLSPADGKEIWTFTTRARVDGSPVIVGDRVFIGSADGRFYGLDRKTGNKVWEYDAGGGFASSPAVAAGRLIIGNDNGDLLCFGAKENQ